MASIDWWMVATNALWILGLSVMLAAVSYHNWLAGELGRRRREQFRDASFRFPAALGFCLVCAGWALSHASHWWSQAIGGVAALFFAGTAVRAATRMSQSPKRDVPRT